MEKKPCKCYSYIGPVTWFGKVICNDFRAITYAPSRKKARRNIIYQFEQEFGLEPNAKINLVSDKLIEEDK